MGSRMGENCMILRSVGDTKKVLKNSKTMTGARHFFGSQGLEAFIELFSSLKWLEEADIKTSNELWGLL